MRLPLNRIENLNKIHRVLRELEQKYEREPTEKEIADQLGIATEEMVKTLKLRASHTSMDAPIGESEDGTLLDVLIDGG